MTGWGLSGPSRLALDGTDLFVAEGSSVLDLNLTTGALVRTVAGPE